MFTIILSLDGNVRHTVGPFATQAHAENDARGYRRCWWDTKVVKCYPIQSCGEHYEGPQMTCEEAARNDA